MFSKNAAIEQQGHNIDALQNYLFENPREIFRKANQSVSEPLVWFIQESLDVPQLNYGVEILEESQNR